MTENGKYNIMVKNTTDGRKYSVCLFLKGEKDMENIRIAVISENRDYGRALGLALVDVYRNFTVTLFRSVPAHDELDKMDLVLTDTQQEIEIKGKFIMLVEKISQIDKDYEAKCFRLYKYSNVRQLAGELLYIYSAVTGRKAAPIRNVNAKVVLFCSPSGGSGCTSAAIAFAREMKRFHDKKVMYLSLEEVESTFAYMEKLSDGKNAGEYLYHLFNDREDNKFPFLESYIVSDPYGVEAFIPSPGRNVMKSLSPEEMTYFAGAVLDTGSYDFLVIDAGCSLEKNVLTCYEMANSICMIQVDDVPSHKTERFMEYIIFAKGEKVAEKVVTSVLPRDAQSFSMQNGICHIATESAYGFAIKELSGKLA